METHELLQGTPEWHTYRNEHDNASDAPAVMGYSSYTSRNDLLKQKATGIKPKVDQAQQNRFDNGHIFEAFARPLAEAIIGEDLYPVTGSLGKYSASFDGLTLDEDVAFEHKTLNEKLRSVLVEGCTGTDLPTEYQIQMEQQCMVSGCDKVLFMASKWEWNHIGDNYVLIEERHCWYTPNGFLRKQIIDAWTQFHIDLAAYQHFEPALPVVASVKESLPAVSVRLNGQLAVATNLPEFGVALRSFVKTIPAQPSTDQEFADCESACKALKKAEDALTAAEDNAMAQVTDVETMRRLVGDLKTLARTTRLASEKVVTARKEAIRIEIITAAKNKYANHVADLNKRNGVSYLGVAYPDFATAIKGKRTISSLHEAVDTLLANAKIDANATADKILANISLSEVKEYNFLFSDLPTLCLKEPGDFMACVAYRVTEHQAKEDARIAAETARIAEQERIKAEAKVRTESLVAEGKISTADRLIQQANDILNMPSAKVSVAPIPEVTQRPRASTRAMVDNLLDGMSDRDLSSVLRYLQDNFNRLAA